MKLEEAIRGFLLDRETGNRSVNTIDWYRSRLSIMADYFHEMGISELESVMTSHLRSFMVHIQQVKADSQNPFKHAQDKPLSMLTVHGYVRAIKAFFHWCYLEELIPRDPSERVARPKIPEYLIPSFRPEHLAAMFDSCDLHLAKGNRDYAVLMVLLDSGIRLSELVGLRLQDVHDTFLTVFGKGSKEREVGIGPTASNALWRYIHRFRKAKNENEERVFLTINGVPIGNGGIYEIIVQFKEVAGIEGIRCSPHTLRHTMARMWLENGGEVFGLSRVLGHSSVTITQTYLKDFQARQARESQIMFSPVESLKNARRKRGRPPKK